MLQKLFGNSIVREIQNELLADKAPLSSILRKARLAARKLDLAEFEKWISSESDGYKNTSWNDLPEYRKIGATPRFFNPYRGWCPIIIEDPQLYEFCHTVPLFQSIAEIEGLLKSEGSLSYAYPPELTKILRDGMDIQFDIRALVSQNQLEAPINAVKNVVLDWAVDLEKAGIVGEGLGFSADDKKEAQTVTQNIYAQNIGNLGNVSERSSVANNLSNNTFSIGDVDRHVQQIQECIPALPPDVGHLIKAEIAKISNNTKAGNKSAIRASFAVIGSICEKVTTNLAAQGIVTLVKSILS
jgi:AbiTii